MLTRECKRLHNEELFNPYSSPNVTWVTKSRSPGQGVWHGWGKTEVPTQYGGEP